VSCRADGRRAAQGRDGVRPAIFRPQSAGEALHPEREPPEDTRADPPHEPDGRPAAERPDPSAPLFAQVSRADTHLDDPGFVDAGNAHVFEDLVVDFALARSLDHDLLTAVDQRPE
jgi:hypothetical protein